MKQLNLIHLAPSDKFKTGIASYADLLEQIFDTYLAREIKVSRANENNYLSLLKNQEGKFIVLAQIGSNEGGIFRALLEQKQMMPNIPRIIEIHDPPYFVLSYTKFLEYISRWFVGRAVRRAFHLVFKNYYTKLLIDQRDMFICKTDLGAKLLNNRLLSLGLSTPVIKIELPNYMDLNLSKRTFSTSKCIGFFGYIHPDKGVHVLVEAAISLVKRKGVNSVPVIHIRGSVADPCYLKYLNDLKLKVIEAGLKDKVRFGDFIPFDELSKFVSNLTAVALPYMDKSRASASGPLLWARTCCVPVLAHSTLAFEATVRNEIDGVLIPINDIDRWTEVMEQIATQPMWGNKFHDGCVKSQSCFSWQVISKKYFDLITQVSCQ